MAVTIGRNTFVFDDDVGAPKPAVKVTPFVDETVETPESKEKAKWTRPRQAKPKSAPKSKTAKAVVHVWCRVCTARPVDPGDDVCRRKQCRVVRARWATLEMKAEKQE